jgi:hypothetical protein
MSKTPKAFVIPKQQKVIERGPKLKRGQGIVMPKGPPKLPKGASFKPTKMTVAKPPKPVAVKAIKVSRGR